MMELLWVRRRRVDQLEHATLQLPPYSYCRPADGRVAQIERAAIDAEPAGGRITQKVRLVAGQILVDDRKRIVEEDDIGIEQHRAKAEGGEAADVNLADEPRGADLVRRGRAQLICKARQHQRRPNACKLVAKVGARRLLVAEHEIVVDADGSEVSDEVDRNVHLVHVGR